MPERLSNPEQYNPYQVIVQLSASELHTMKRVAFVVNPDIFNIIIGDRHERIIDGNNLNTQDYRGGDIWLEENDITFKSVSLGDVKEEDRAQISEAIRHWLSTLSK